MGITADSRTPHNENSASNQISAARTGLSKAMAALFVAGMSISAIACQADKSANSPALQFEEWSDIDDLDSILLDGLFRVADLPQDDWNWVTAYILQQTQDIPSAGNLEISELAGYGAIGLYGEDDHYISITQSIRRYKHPVEVSLFLDTLSSLETTGSSSLPLDLDLPSDSTISKCLADQDFLSCTIIMTRGHLQLRLRIEASSEINHLEMEVIVNSILDIVVQRFDSLPKE